MQILREQTAKDLHISKGVNQAAVAEKVTEGTWCKGNGKKRVKVQLCPLDE